MELTPEQLARIEKNKQEALARLERKRLLQLEQQNNNNNYQNNNQSNNNYQNNNQLSNTKNQNSNNQQNTNQPNAVPYWNPQKQSSKGNREHYKQASLEEKQIQARINYKTHQQTGTPIGRSDIWTEKKKKDELLEDTEEYKLVKQRMELYNNDASMVVVNMDSAFDHNRTKKQNTTVTVTSTQITSTSTVTSSSSDVVASCDEWTGLLSVIGRMNKSDTGQGDEWVKKPPAKDESEIKEDNSSENPNPPTLSRNNSSDFSPHKSVTSNSPVISRNNSESNRTPPISRNNSGNDVLTSNNNKTPPARTNSGNGDLGNKTPIGRNNSSDDLHNDKTPKNNHTKQDIKNYFTPTKASPSPTKQTTPPASYPTTPGNNKNFYLNSFKPTNSPSSSPISSGNTSSPATPATPSPATPTTPTPPATPATPANQKAFKKSNTPAASTSTTTKTVQQKIKFTSVTLNAKAKPENENTSHHRIPDLILKQGYDLITSDAQRRNLMAPCDPIGKKKGSERSWVCWCVVYSNGHTSFRKNTTTPAKRKKVAQTVPTKPEVLGICFYRTSSKGGDPQLYVLPLSEKTTRDENLEFLVQFLEAEEVCKVCHNTQDAFKVVLEAYPKLSPKTCLDPQIGAWVSKPESIRYHFPEMVRFLIPKISRFEKLSQGGMMTAQELISVDQFDCLALMEYLFGVLEEDSLIPPLCDEMDLIPVLSKMEMEGIGFDPQVLEPCKEAIMEKMDTIKAEAEDLISYSVNFNSPQNVAHVLFDVLKLKVPQDKYSGKKSHNTRKGNRSTGEPVLKKLESQHKLPSMILEYRHCQKLLSNWVDSLVGQAKPDQDGNLRIHAHWISNGTSTGRLASTDPNLQNIPKSRTTMGKVTFHVRDSFCAASGWVLIGADYSQIELRVLAHISRDPTLLSFFGEGVDVLKMVASHWMGKPVEEITSEDRDYTKRIVYGILYGIGAPSLASMLKVSIGEAQVFMSTFLGKFPKVRHFIDSTVASAKREKFVRTITGRLRRLPNITAGGNQGQQALRQAVNTVIQGTAADVVKAAMIGVNNVVKQDDRLCKSVKLLLQIHDELVYEVKEEIAAEFLEIMQKTMVTSLNLSVPLTLSVKTGKSWGSMKPLDASGNANDNLDEESIADEFEFQNEESVGDEEEEDDD
eukprot:Phypoly_transcript_01132.p1 GENE.Phypoly_transcript_01132~~Phypoly_transcript_01132.p1  ORF type:complete len:1152 (+),score=225.98 Phypoly_transcript_01132:71-3526(+)